MEEVERIINRFQESGDLRTFYHEIIRDSIRRQKVLREALLDSTITPEDRQVAEGALRQSRQTERKAKMYLSLLNST